MTISVVSFCFVVLMALLRFGVRVLFDYAKLDSKSRRRLAKVQAKLKEVATTKSKGLLMWVGKLLVLTACGLIVYQSAESIYDFTVSTAPIARREILQLLMNGFNAFMYFLATMSMVFIIFLPKRKEEAAGNLVITRREGETIWLTAGPSADTDSLVKALTGPGVAISIEKLKASCVTLSVRAPAEILIHRSQPGNV